MLLHHSASADELFSVGLGDLANKLGPAHGALNLAASGC